MAERVTEEDCDDARLSIEAEADPTLIPTSAGSAEDRDGLWRDGAFDVGATGTVSSAAVFEGRAEWGSPAKSSLMCSRQKSRAGAEPTAPVRSRAMTHLHTVKEHQILLGNAAGQLLQPIRKSHFKQLLEKRIGYMSVTQAPRVGQRRRHFGEERLRRSHAMRTRASELGYQV